MTGASRCGGRFRLLIGVLAGLLVLCPPAFAGLERVVSLTGRDQAVGLLPMAYVFEDTGSMTPAEAAVRLSAPDVSVAEQVFSQGYVDATIWTRVSIDVEDSAAGRWYLALELSNFDRLDVYPSWLVDISATGATPAFSLGDRVPEGRAIRSRFHLREVELPPGRHTVLFKGRTSSTLTLPLRLWRPDALHIEEQGFLLLQGFYFGLAMLLAAATTLIAAYLWQPIFLVFAINATAHSTAWLILNGVGPGYIWPTLARSWEISSHGFVALAISSIFAFSAMFLSGPGVPRIVNPMLWSLAVAAALLSGAVFITPRDYTLYVNIATGQILLPTAIVLLVGTLVALVRGERTARLLLVAWSGLAIGGAVAMARDMGMVPSNVLTFTGPQLGSTLEMLVFAFMLAGHIRDTHREKERLQAAALAASREQEARLERRVAERTAALDAANRRLSAIVEAAPFPLLLEREADDILLFINRRAAELFGFPSPDAAVGRDSPVRFVREADRAAMLAELAHDEVATDHEIELHRSDGTRFWALHSAVRIEHDGQPVRLIALNDITSMKALESYLRGAAAQEREARRIQRQFVEMVSHEFRTPLAVIDGAAQNMLTGDLRDRNRVQKIRSAVQRLLRLIHGCLAEERGGSGRIELNPEPLDLVGLLRDAVDQARTTAPDHHFSVVADSDPAPMSGDWRLLEIAIGNLLENAAKYSPRGSRIEVSLGRADGALEIRVADEGMGIAPAEHEQIFGKYYRSSGTAGIAGAGLGLHLVRMIAEAHGGKVRCMDGAGSGSVFVLTLPSARQPSADPDALRMVLT